MTQPIPNRGGRFGGFSLVEALAAATILGFALLVGVAVVAWADRVEARAEARVAGLELAASLAERARAAPYFTLSSGELDLSGELLPPLPEPRAWLEVEENEDLRLKRVVIVVTWGGPTPGRLELETAIGSAEIYRP